MAAARRADALLVFAPPFLLDASFYVVVFARSMLAALLKRDVTWRGRVVPGGTPDAH